MFLLSAILVTLLTMFIKFRFTSLESNPVTSEIIKSKLTMNDIGEYQTQAPAESYEMDELNYADSDEKNDNLEVESIQHNKPKKMNLGGLDIDLELIRNSPVEDSRSSYPSGHDLDKHTIINRDNTTTTNCKILEKTFCSETTKNSATNPFAFKDVKLIFYNQVPKCGSTTTFKTIWTNAVENENFLAVVAHQTRIRNMSAAQEFGIAGVLSNLAAKSKKPIVYARHLPFIDFEIYNLTSPTFINVIRDPLDRAESIYWYNRQHLKNIAPNEWNISLVECLNSDKCPDTNGSLSSSYLEYFCGNFNGCGPSIRSAVDRSKDNINRYWSVLGLMSDLNSYFEVLEFLHPHIFSGIKHTYSELMQNGSGILNSGIGKVPFSAEVKDILRQRLWGDIELYSFVQQRFYHQLQQARKRTNLAQEYNIELKDCIAQVQTKDGTISDQDLLDNLNKMCWVRKHSYTHIRIQM